MKSVATLAYWEGLILLGGLFGIVFWKLLTGGISLSGLLDGDRREGSDISTSFSPGRVQLLMFTISSALYYLLQVIDNPSSFPKVPDALVAVLGGSHAVYLGGKAQGLLSYRFKDTSKTGE